MIKKKEYAFLGGGTYGELSQPLVGSKEKISQHLASVPSGNRTRHNTIRMLCQLS